MTYNKRRQKVTPTCLRGKGKKRSISIPGKRPKYIQNILKAAELRKKEQEKRMEKKIQKEREMEGDAFDDKEAFVTSAYKKKLQERAEEEEREKREAAIEACLDVTKQKDLSGFYRHLLNQTVGEEEMPKCSLREARLKEEEPTENPNDGREMSKSPDEKTRAHIPVKGEDNPDAGSDLEIHSSEDESSAEVQTSSRAGDKKENRPGRSDCSGESSRRRKSRRDSGSSSEERSRPLKEREDGGRKEKSGQHRERDRERRHKDHDKEEHYKRQEERDNRQRRKDRKERDDYHRELRQERDREDKYSEWEQQVKERQTSHKEHHGERDRDRDEKKHQERRTSSPSSLVKGSESEGRKETPSDSERSPELKHKTSGEGTEQAEKPLESQSKFAKRSNQETVTSARDRYLARQMARVGTKSYIEKEED
ncbi:nuclear speckle splicing regulatory protein 1 isoform X2 [Elgaria multicarinata webbii]|uniref:nuclear speckle splicing regulatory protein 1 isoform X2 n=1 Tax=Elgaria multicarinata webbii TaxID=159646 RepID=UPI002FCD11C9